ncbi:MAG: lytic transglycosylase domain-containing protein, partial [Rhodospirillales bacterium]|nr:lytic transglycosylase domain-containing protein [Rhodospirillales bacterium]
IAGENDFSLPPLPHTDKVVVHGFAHHELARAVRALHAAELPALMRPLIRQLSQLGSTPGWMAETARLAADVGRPDLAVLVAKSALAQGIGLVATGYPVLPRSHIQVSLESPFIHAVIRQESAFYQEAVSHAGAQGLMQLMPRTARRVAKMNSIPYRLGRLTEDAAYNMRLGQTFLRELLNEFDGSYVLALAAYNAGPGRARSWMKRNGDPRDPAVDAIDWVELIPFSETRNYVQRVLENFHVYREILNDTEVAIGPESLLRK